MIRPGPPWIERDTYPGGIVLYVYAGPPAAPVLLLTSMLRDGDPIEARAERDGALVAELVAAGSVVLVVYDGDTGERLRPAGRARQ